MRTSVRFKLLATMTAASVAVTGLAFVAPAGATASGQSDDWSTSPSSRAAAPSGDAAGARHRPHRIARRIAARAAAESIGVTIEQLRDAVLGGQTVADFAAAQGADAAAVQADVAGALTDAIDQAVANGRVTEERAASARERVDDVAERFMTSLPRQGAVPTT